jgi:Tol biopolymer transport system component
LESVGPERGCFDPRLPPDEKRLAASCADPRRGLNIWFTDLARGVTTPFTLNGINEGPVWSPDGTRIVYRSLRAYKGEFYLKSAAGGGSEEPVFLEDAQLAVHTVNPIATDWSPDGRYLIYSTLTSAFGNDLWLLPVTGNNRTPSAYLSAPSDQLHAAFSPDGRFVAYSSNESGRFEVYVQTFPLSDRRWQISVSGGYEPRWRRNAREIYFLSADGKLMVAPVAAAKELEAGTPKALFQAPVRSEPNPLGWTYDASGDGQRFLVNTPSVDDRAAPITVVLNWTAGVKR